MGDEDDWDTSGHDELPTDKYNKSKFGTATGESASESVEQGMENLTVEEAPKEEESVSEQQGSEEAPPAPPAPPAVPEPPAPPTVPEPPAPAPVPVPVVKTTTTTTSAQPSSEKTSSPPSGRKGSTPIDVPDFLKESHQGQNAFTTKLSPEGLKFFNDLCEKPFAEQAVAFLNAYWKEVGDQAEFIFSVGYDRMRYADMHSKGVQYVHLYQEGNLLDFNIGLYFYEQLCKLVLDSDEGKKWREDPKFAMSMPEMMTAIKRKIELREKVDCNFDGQVSFLEYLLYQYQSKCNPADFVERAMKTEHLEEHPEIVKARKALEEVNKAIQAYEAEKHRLTELSQQPGVKGLGAKHQLAILDASPLAEQLNKSLITAEAAVRIACRKFGSGKVVVTDSGEAEPQMRRPTDGSVWWLNRDLQQKQELYGKRKK